MEFVVGYVSVECEAPPFFRLQPIRIGGMESFLKIFVGFTIVL